MSRERRLPSRLLVIADASHAGGDLPALAGRLAAAGARFLELRRARPPGAPALAAGPFVEEVRACLAAAPAAVVLVNDRADVALLAGAQGAHVGQDDLPPRVVRLLLGEDAWVGLSTHDPRQCAAAQDEPVDYVAVGPIFLSATKWGHAEPLGLDGLRACAQVARKPLVAIGGITAANAAAVLDAGAAAVAVASAAAVGDVGAKVSALLRAVGEGT